MAPASNHVQNGLILRTDLHRLYDGGYITVTPDHRLEVSRRLREEFDNGEEYYRMQGRSLTLPDTAALKPSRDALLWHADHVFR
jgi:putative restriction endonuclease